MTMKRFLFVFGGLVALCLAVVVDALRLTAAPLADVLADQEMDIPSVSVKDFGATGTGLELDTTAFTQAVARLSSLGGGTLVVPAGTYLVTTITLANNITLLLERDATLLSTNNSTDWEKPLAVYQVKPMCGGLQNKPWAGGPVVFCANCKRIAVIGEGCIDGQGQKWWSLRKDALRRGYLLLFVNCTDVYVSGITLQNAPSWNIVPKFSRNVTIENILILNDYVQSHNTDGINPYGCDGVIIRDSIIVTGDDCIAIKSGPRPSCGIPSQNILVHNITCIGSHGLTIGSEMNAGVRNITFSNVTIDGRNTKSSQGVRLKSQRGRGGLVENVLYENIRIHNVKIGIQVTLNYQQVDKDVRPTPHFKNITIKNVFGTSVRRQLGSIDGLEEAPIEQVSLENIYLFGEGKAKDFRCRDAVQVSFSNVFPWPRLDPSCTTRSLSLADMMTLSMPKWLQLPHWFW